MYDEKGVTQFHTIGVKVTRRDDGTLHADYDPPKTDITSENAVISFQLAERPRGVVFWGANIAPCTSDFGPPGITVSGRMLTIEDTDRDKETTSYHITLWVFDPRLRVPVSIDPQIINRKV